MAELEREADTYAERLAGLEQKLEAAAVRPPEPALDPLPAPIPPGRITTPWWKRWLGTVRS